ncbi:hypothetical protein GX411_11445 [Candidatus Fermentibacteria bacterium]|nr:hypothetical protein [Candidatus Fermentibacteria bacterium]
MLSLLIALAALSAAGPEDAIVTVKRDRPAGITEVMTGIAISPRHVLLLASFATSDAPPYVASGRLRVDPDTVFYSRDLGLAILSFDDAGFDGFMKPCDEPPVIGDDVRLVGQGVTGTVTAEGRVLDESPDGIFLVSAPRIDGLMGAGAFDSEGRLIGVIRGAVGSSLGSRAAVGTDYLALLPARSWLVWSELAMSGGWHATSSFGVTATSCSDASGERPSGVLIVAVDDGSPACLCGLRPGDVVTHVESLRVFHPETMRSLLVLAEDSIEARVWTRGTERSITLPPLR